MLIHQKRTYLHLNLITKIKALKQPLEHIITLCQKQNPSAQKELYQQYSPILFGICRRYIKVYEDAEDMLIEGFYKIFSKVGDFKGEGSFEGWMKRIMVNECLMFLRKKNNLHMTLEIMPEDVKMESKAQSNLQYEDVIQLLENLPTGYRTVFNLYVIEGYKHREIAELLGISINTSKCQLILAKKKLKDLLKKKQIIKVS